MKDQEVYTGVLDVLLIPGGGLLAWTAKKREVLLLSLLHSPQHHRAASDVYSVVTTLFQLVLKVLTINIACLNLSIVVLLTK